MKKILSSLLVVILLVMTLLTGCKFTIEIGNYTFTNEREYTEYTDGGVTVDSITAVTLDIDWINGNVEVTTGDKLEISEENISGKYIPLYYSVGEKVIAIKFCKNGTLQKVFNDCTKKLKVVIPEGFEEIKLNTVSSGNTITVNDFKSISINVVSGNTDVSVNSIKTFKINSVSGNCTLGIKDTRETESINGEFVSGNYTITVDGIREFDIKFNSVSGGLTQPTLSGVDTTLPKLSIKCDSVSGDLTIQKDN